jgi:8-oxo-dGTP pyrophosphatase MutT (NUDIX family)
MRLDVLAATLARRERRLRSSPRRAAVLLPLIGGTTDSSLLCLSLLLTRRSEKLPSHKGQVAFPGGKREPGEDFPVGTALREAEEEVGLKSSDVKILGLLDELPSISADLTVAPVVGRIAPHVGLSDLTADANEVSRMFSIPIKSLCDGDRWETRIEEWKGEKYPMYYFKYDGEKLWGLSAYATLILLGLLPESTAPRLPQSWTSFGRPGALTERPKA